MLASRVSAVSLRPFAMSIALKEMTVDEFLLWAEGQEGRWELHDGVAKQIMPERADHVRTKGEAFVALRFASRRAGCDCEVFGSGPGVQIDQRTVYVPDGAIVCGPKLPDSAILLVNLIVVVEVLSSSTAAIDRGESSAAISRFRASATISSSIPSGASSFTTSVESAMR